MSGNLLYVPRNTYATYFWENYDELFHNGSQVEKYWCKDFNNK